MNLSDIITPQVSQPMSRQKSSSFKLSKHPKHVLQQHQNNIKNNQIVTNLMSKNILKVQSIDCSTLCQKCQKIRQQLNARSQELTESKIVLEKKESQLRSLQQQFMEIKLQDQYLLQVIEDLRDNKSKKSEPNQPRLDKIYRQKVEQLNFAHKQISKLKEWLKEEKVQVFRYIECVHIKDQIINNLQNQLIKLRQNKPIRKKSKKIQSSTTMIQEDQLTKFRRKAKQLQEQVYQLTQQIDTMRNDNSMLKQHLSRVSQNLINSSQQVASPILKLKESIKISPSLQPNQPTKTQEKQNTKNTNSITTNNANMNKKQKLLSNKCMHLQAQIQRLLIKIEQLKKQNENIRGLYRKQYSFARLGQNQHEMQEQKNIYKAD